MMDIFMSETCWAHKKWNKIASDIKLVFYSSTITMMHGPIDISIYNNRRESRTFHYLRNWRFCRWCCWRVQRRASSIGKLNATLSTPLRRMAEKISTRDSSAGIASRYRLESPGIESPWGRNFPHTSSPALEPTQPPIKWVPVLSRGKAAGAWRWPPIPTSAEVKEIVEIYLYSPSGPSWPVLRWTLLYFILLYFSSINSYSRRLMAVGGQLQAPAAFTTEQNPNAFWLGDCVSPTAGLNILMNIYVKQRRFVEYLPTNSGVGSS